MPLKRAVAAAAREIGFADIGFTGIDPFSSQQQLLQERAEYYRWTSDKGLDLLEGTVPSLLMPEAKSMIVVLDNYYQGSFPASMVGKFGRCYLDDDRITKDRLAIKIKQLRNYLRENGIQSKVANDLPQRLAAARAGLGTFGKNNFFYASRTARQSSWVVAVAILTDGEFAPDEPSIAVTCPQWCRNACIASCPTGAILGPNKIDPQRCISYLTYYGEELTPRELREPMGMWVYGCDRCQSVCPRNEPWLAQELPKNERVLQKSVWFELPRLLHMDKEYFKQNIQPHMFYMSSRDIWRWKMNVARVMGNSCDRQYVSALISAYPENDDERVQAMIVWALGKLGGASSIAALRQFAQDASGIVKAEIAWALASAAETDGNIFNSATG
ncbi:MAG TPA: 4Fe-4S double cluster binding domain-containing protein [Syntrophomonas sp.]|nr:4Fe-4S double cluster binding domain-containing protein [Syntrophomonas sp.]